VAEVTLTDGTFVPPDAFDALGFVEDSIAGMPQTWRVDVWLHATIDEARRWFPPTSAVLKSAGEGVAASYSTNDLDEAAQFLAQLPCSLEIHSPHEIRAALERLAERIANLARLTTAS
jgi:predicted DNA-binding transcriptional regulator YafY